MSNVKKYTDRLDQLQFSNMYDGDFFLTWEKSREELEAVFTVADALRHLRENNVSTRIFDTGLGISLFRDNSTRTRFSFASACNLLGLAVQDLDEGKSQVAVNVRVNATDPLSGGVSQPRRFVGRGGGLIGEGGTALHHEVWIPYAAQAGCLSRKPTLSTCSAILHPRSPWDICT
jgi:hypothetical protein